MPGPESAPLLLVPDEASTRPQAKHQLAARDSQEGASSRGRAEAVVIGRTIACMRFLVPGPRNETAASYLSLVRLCLFNLRLSLTSHSLPHAAAPATPPSGRCLDGDTGRLQTLSYAPPITAN
ncbi:uncharacterized protein TrAtP1_005397 [Trichoderma atroviride]|uniref:Uncharacterized protein n=1 Tax=Hypocrea atroviridis (strain ATCC 20476 / IMI 206040) TaxID=452589 RepID=G9NRJ9_HYPAI|nr:uncharacterized protein TRIATDRAFT_317581 [Trichoderma atroviride IMI 206040]EHK46632.1 hypothetical protein TRIATDRAFT_317581 [Trichoderma atroviride IMI 206040]UKZ64177.1 hypothetical protein TrAtP1_005397 [Trichoderma atroviride]